MSDGSDTTSPETGSGLRFVRRCSVVMAWLFGIVALLAAVASVALIVLFARGPIDVAAVSAGAEQALREVAGPGAVARVGEARLDWSVTDGVSVDVTDVVLDRGEGVGLMVPRLSVRLRALPMLLGRLEPRVIEIHGPRLSFDTAELHARSSSVPVAVDAPADAMAGPPMPVPPSTRFAESLDAALESAVSVARGFGFGTVVVRGAELEVRHRPDAATVRRIVFRDIEIDAVVDGPGGEFDASISAKGEIGRWSMRLTRVPRDDGGRRLDFVASDVTLHDLIGPGGPAFGVGMPAYPRLSASFGAEGTFQGAELDLRLGAGELRFGPMREDSVLFDEAQMHALWKPRERVFEIDRTSFAVGATHMSMHGRIRPPPVPDRPWGVEMTLDGGMLAPREASGTPVPVVGGGLVGAWNPVTSIFEISSGDVRFGGASLHSAGRLDLSGPEPRFQYDLQFTPMTANEVAHAWPHWVAPDARTWFLHNVGGGRFLDTRIRLDMPRFDRPETWPGTAFQMTGRWEGLKFDPFGSLPAVTGGEGRITIADRRLEASVDKARVATRWPRQPSLDGLRFAIPDIFARPPKATIRFTIAGDTGGLAEIVDAEPLLILQQAGMAATGLAGTGTVISQIDLVFDKVIDAKSVDYRIEAQLDGFGSSQPIQGRKFQDGKFKIVADGRGLDVAGRASVDGVPADVHVFEPRVGGKGAEKRDFKMMIDDATRQRMGLDLGGMVEGAMGLSVSQPDPGQMRSRIEADLGPARLVLPWVGWTKGSGVPAKATFDLWDDDKGLHIDNLVLDSEGLSVRGSLLLDKADRSVISADLPKLTLRRGDVAKLKIGRGADKVTTVTFDATSFDVRGMLQTLRRPSARAETTGKADAGEFVFKLKGGTLQGFNDTTLSEVTLEGRIKGRVVTSLDFKARSADRKTTSAAIRPEGDHRRFTMASDDAGGVLSFLDLFDRVSGGRLALSSRLGAAGSSEGTARLLDFHLLEEPKSGRATAREEGGVRVVPIRRVEIDRSTNFDRASVRFAIGEGIVSVGEVVAKGASVGATASGQIDLNSQRLSLSGTYIPAFGLNNLAGRIPILGAIAGAGSDEGLVGVTFRIVGPIEDPLLQINPLSAAAPGIFRKIFEFQKEDLPVGTGDPNAPTRITPDGAPTKITP